MQTGELWMFHLMTQVVISISTKTFCLSFETKVKGLIDDWRITRKKYKIEMKVFWLNVLSYYLGKYIQRNTIIRIYLTLSKDVNLCLKFSSL